MKKTVLFTATLLLLSMYSVNAQVIPNSGFETWSNDSNAAPDGWEDRGSSITGFYPVTRSTDKYMGKYAARIENKVTATDTIIGILNSVRPNNNHGFGPAFPIATRYNNLKGFYKYVPLNGDSTQIIVYLTKTGFNNPYGFRNLLAFGLKNMGAAPTYTPFSVGYFDSLATVFYFDNSAVPDSGYLTIAAYKYIGPTGGSRPLGNSVLYVDALNFDSYLVGINQSMDITSNFQLFPNANSGNFDVSFGTAGNEYTTIKIYNMEGKEMMNLFSGSLSSGNHTFHHSTQQLSNGNYLYIVASDKGYRTEKLVIQK